MQGSGQRKSRIEHWAALTGVLFAAKNISLTPQRKNIAKNALNLLGWKQTGSNRLNTMRPTGKALTPPAMNAGGSGLLNALNVEKSLTPKEQIG